MAGNLHTALVSILWTNVLTQGVDRDVIASEGHSLTLLFGLSIDTALWNTAWAFVANFQVTEVATGQGFNHYWRAPLNALPKSPSLWLSMSWARAEWAGVSHAPVRTAVSPPAQITWSQVGDGMYLYRPYIEILVPSPPPHTFIPLGRSGICDRRRTLPPM
jgi:hypothetical protein